VGLGAVDAGDGLGHPARLADHLEIGLPAQFRPHPRPEHRVIVDEKDPHGHLIHSSSVPGAGHTPAGHHRYHIVQCPVPEANSRVARGPEPVAAPDGASRPSSEPAPDAWLPSSAPDGPASVAASPVSSRGMNSRTSVPRPGVDRISTRPPRRSIRPRIDLARPCRSPGTSAGSKPAPRSRTNTLT